ncbi:hypothetical protein JTB14_029536 [Gonioctena quinquepunctata]|nr:hypothetical protein JTB14_029536 [Gonioctena quinquepunctata]
MFRYKKCHKTELRVNYASDKTQNIMTQELRNYLTMYQPVSLKKKFLEENLVSLGIHPAKRLEFSTLRNIEGIGNLSCIFCLLREQSLLSKSTHRNQPLELRLHYSV